MAISAATRHVYFPNEEPVHLASHRITRYLVPLGRLLFVAMFLKSVPGHFAPSGVEYATSAGVPWPELLVPISGVLLALGGLSVLLGYQARFGAFLLVLFLVPVTLMMHRYWAIEDPQAAMMQSLMFWKNVSMLGAALVLTHFGAGPISLDAVEYKALAARGPEGTKQ